MSAKGMMIKGTTDCETKPGKMDNNKEEKSLWGFFSRFLQCL